MPASRTTVRAVEDFLRDLCRDAKPGDRLPPAKDLQARCGAGEKRLSAALRTLTAEGVLHARHRVGLFAGPPEAYAPCDLAACKREWARKNPERMAAARFRFTGVVPVSLEERRADRQRERARGRDYIERGPWLSLDDPPPAGLGLHKVLPWQEFLGDRSADPEILLLGASDLVGQVETLFSLREQHMIYAFGEAGDFAAAADTVSTPEDPCRPCEVRAVLKTARRLLGPPRD